MRLAPLLLYLPLAVISLTARAETAVAYFAGGCFWCTEADFEKLPGINEAVSGYMGGQKANPSYEEVSAGGTGHTESVRVSYDPAKVSYAQLLAYFWPSIDPTTPNAQFCDHGSQYRTAVFVQNATERRAAEKSKQAAAKQLGNTVVTEISDAGPFYPAEDYHQDYYKKNPVRYNLYRAGCGRDKRLHEIWNGTRE